MNGLIDQKENLNTFQMGEIISSIFCDHKLLSHGEKLKSPKKNNKTQLKCVISNILGNSANENSPYQT